jgi:hypothetical protein
MTRPERLRSSEIRSDRRREASIRYPRANAGPPTDRTTQDSPLDTLLCVSIGTRLVVWLGCLN